MRKNKASSTARLITRCMLFLHYEGSSLSHGASVKLWLSCLKSYGSSPDLLAYCIRFKLIRLFIRIIQSLILPNLIYHYGMRKQMIRKAIERFLNSNPFDQFIHLGAGFDTYSQDVSGMVRTIQCMEMDHPATQEVKLRALEESGIKSQELEFLPVDLTESGSFKCITRKQSLIIAEGLFMYFSPSRLQSLLYEIRRNTDGCFLIFTFIDKNRGQPDFFENSPLINLYLRYHQEPFLWGISSEDMESFLNQNGFSMIEILDPSESLSQQMDRRISRRIKEKICIARSLE